MRKTRVLLALVLMLCMVTALVPVTAHAETEPTQILLLAVDTDALGADEAKLLVPADKDKVDAVIGSTDVCPESEKLFTSGDANIVQARLHRTNKGITALTKLSDGKEVTVTGHAILQYRGEYKFGSDKGPEMFYGIAQEGSDSKCRFYTTKTLWKLDLPLGKMARNSKIFLNKEFYDLDENGYFDHSAPGEVDKDLKGRYIRAYFYNGFPETSHMTDNLTLCKCHVYNWDHQDASWAPTCTTAGGIQFNCLNCEMPCIIEIEPTGHTWDKGKVTKKPTSDKDGVMTYTCTVCKATRTEVIPATGK